MARRPTKGQTVHIKPKRKGQKRLSFKAGGLHASTHTPMGQKIPASKKRDALSGKLGLKAEKQALFARNVLVGRKGRRRKRGGRRRR